MIVRIDRRRPFNVIGMPLVARIARARFTPRRRLAKRLIGKPLRLVHDFVYRRLGLGGTIEIDLATPNGVRRIAGDARNLNFGALYLPQYADGYEVEVAAALDALIPADGVFYDIGANFGYFSAWVCSRPGFKGAVHAFEPNPETVRDLRAVAAHLPQMSVHPVGLGDTEGTARLDVSADFSGQAKISAGGTVTVEVRTLDGLDLPPPDVIKLDVEGFEAAALRGARKILTGKRPVVIFESWLTDDGRDDLATMSPFAVLTECGYAFYVAAVKSADGCYRAVHPGKPPAEDTLHLVPFTAEQRGLLATEQLNVIAIPA